MNKIRHPQQATRRSSPLLSSDRLRRGGEVLLEAISLIAFIVICWIWLVMLSAVAI